ncbi:uncharacterized protein MONOS_11930 [Monocercomonoides exilis]|uniref:uncharacterized protein n=1 Tax=Monocercomonoides exilis TaxID=2049356 RepID=UPI003559BF9E|nr:hypothetical protein MONOS_11930 [Monocercomonoides exilis]
MKLLDTTSERTAQTTGFVELYSIADAERILHRKTMAFESSSLLKDIVFFSKERRKEFWIASPIKRSATQTDLTSIPFVVGAEVYPETQTAYIQTSLRSVRNIRSIHLPFESGQSITYRPLNPNLFQSTLLLSFDINCITKMASEENEKLLQSHYSILLKDPYSKANIQFAPKVTLIPTFHKGKLYCGTVEYPLTPLGEKAAILSFENHLFPFAFKNIRISTILRSISERSKGRMGTMIETNSSRNISNPYDHQKAKQFACPNQIASKNYFLEIEQIPLKSTETWKHDITNSKLDQSNVHSCTFERIEQKNEKELFDKQQLFMCDQTLLTNNNDNSRVLFQKWSKNIEMHGGNEDKRYLDFKNCFDDQEGEIKTSDFKDFNEHYQPSLLGSNSKLTCPNIALDATESDCVYQCESSNSLNRNLHFQKSHEDAEIQAFRRSPSIISKTPLWKFMSPIHCFPFVPIIDLEKRVFSAPDVERDCFEQSNAKNHSFSKMKSKTNNFEPTVSNSSLIFPASTVFGGVIVKGSCGSSASTSCSFAIQSSSSVPSSQVCSNVISPKCSCYNDKEQKDNFDQFQSVDEDCFDKVTSNYCSGSANVSYVMEELNNNTINRNLSGCTQGERRHFFKHSCKLKQLKRFVNEQNNYLMSTFHHHAFAHAVRESISNFACQEEGGVHSLPFSISTHLYLNSVDQALIEKFQSPFSMLFSFIPKQLSIPAPFYHPRLRRFCCILFGKLSSSKFAQKNEISILFQFCVSFLRNQTTVDNVQYQIYLILCFLQKKQQQLHPSSSKTSSSIGTCQLNEYYEITIQDDFESSKQTNEPSIVATRNEYSKNCQQFPFSFQATKTEECANNRNRESEKANIETFHVCSDVINHTTNNYENKCNATKRNKEENSFNFKDNENEFEKEENKEKPTECVQNEVINEEISKTIEQNENYLESLSDTGSLDSRNMYGEDLLDELGSSFGSESYYSENESLISSLEEEYDDSYSDSALSDSDDTSSVSSLFVDKYFSIRYSPINQGIMVSGSV